MSAGPALSEQTLEALRSYDTCTVSNAVEMLDNRLRNEGFTDRSIHRVTTHPAALVGHAVTVRIRATRPPMRGRFYEDRTDWWNHIPTIPTPRVVVVQDMDSIPGKGTFLGEIHATILMALGCVGGITNGAVRDVPAAEKMGFQLFAGNCTVSHGYAHIVDIGHPVEIAGLTIHPSDLLHADMHGVLRVPMAIAEQIPATVRQTREHERHLIELCHSPEFSIEKLRTAVKIF